MMRISRGMSVNILYFFLGQILRKTKTLNKNLMKLEFFNTLPSRHICFI